MVLVIDAPGLTALDLEGALNNLAAGGAEAMAVNGLRVVVGVPIEQSHGPATMDLPGKLKVHGVTKDVTTHLSVQLNGADIELVGSISLDMRDYNIDVPDISFTKAEPTVLIEYHLILSRS